MERHRYSEMHIDVFGERIPKEIREVLLSVRCDGERDFQLITVRFSRIGLQFRKLYLSSSSAHGHAKVETVMAEVGPRRR